MTMGIWYTSGGQWTGKSRLEQGSGRAHTLIRNMYTAKPPGASAFPCHGGSMEWESRT